MHGAGQQPHDDVCREVIAFLTALRAGIEVPDAAEGRVPRKCTGAARRRAAARHSVRFSETGAEHRRSGVRTGAPPDTRSSALDVSGARRVALLALNAQIVPAWLRA